MNNQEKILFKNKLKQFCEEQIQHRIDASRLAIANARESTNQESKSTVGDKYETARAMGQMDQDMHTKQLAENIKELSALKLIDANNICEEAKAGAFIQCQHVSFYISIGLGKKIFEGKTIFFLSPNVPIAKILLHKKIGERFTFNGTNEIIENLF